MRVAAADATADVVVAAAAGASTITGATAVAWLLSSATFDADY